MKRRLPLGLSRRDNILLTAQPQPNGCWLWTGAMNRKGYGLTTDALAHRAAYEEFVGAVPEGMQLDHLCRNRDCVNPAHLESVTPAENSRRGLHGALRATCHNGHDLAVAGIRVLRGRIRRCEVCYVASERRRRAKRAARRAALSSPQINRGHSHEG